MGKRIALLMALALCGCSKHTDPSPMYHVHRVWMDTESMRYQDDHGFTCARIERTPNGWMYMADVLNWSGDEGSKDLHTSWNTLDDATRWVERWCHLEVKG